MTLSNGTFYSGTGNQQIPMLCINNVPILDEDLRERAGVATGCFHYNTLATADFSQPSSVGTTVTWKVDDPCSKGTALTQSPDGFHILPVGQNSIYASKWTHVGVLDINNAAVPTVGTGRLLGYRANWRMWCLFDMRLLTPSGGNRITFDCDMQLRFY